MSCFNFVFTFIVIIFIIICLSYFSHNSICICSIVIIFCLGLKAHFCWVQFSPFQTSNSSSRKALQQAYRPMPSSPPGPFLSTTAWPNRAFLLRGPMANSRTWSPAQQLAALPTGPAVPMASLAILPSPSKPTYAQITPTCDRPFLHEPIAPMLPRRSPSAAPT